MQPLPEYKNRPELKDKITAARKKRDNRIGTGCDPLIAGWQCFLEEMLVRLEAYLVPGNLVTFQVLEASDREQFDRLHDSLILPPHVCSIYIPPAILNGPKSAVVEPVPHRQA